MAALVYLGFGEEGDVTDFRLTAITFFPSASTGRSLGNFTSNSSTSTQQEASEFWSFWSAWDWQRVTSRNFSTTADFCSTAESSRARIICILGIPGSRGVLPGEGGSLMMKRTDFSDSGSLTNAKSCASDVIAANATTMTMMDFICSALFYGYLVFTIKGDTVESHRRRSIEKEKGVKPLALIPCSISSGESASVSLISSREPSRERGRCLHASARIATKIISATVNERRILIRLVRTSLQDVFLEAVSKRALGRWSATGIRLVYRLAHDLSAQSAILYRNVADRCNELFPLRPACSRRRQKQSRDAIQFFAAHWLCGMKR